MEAFVAKKIELFFKQYQYLSFKKGEILVRAGEDPAGVFYLTKGAVKEYAISKKGEELVINIFKPISFFPMSWAINLTPNAYYFEAMENGEIWRAPRKSAISFIQENPDVLYNLMSRVYKGTDGILMKMVYLMSGEAYARVITELLISAKRFGKFISKKSVKLNISEVDMANLTGMARETVSREIKILKDKNLVNFSKSTLTIDDLEKLEEELSAN